MRKIHFMFLVLMAVGAVIVAPAFASAQTDDPVFTELEGATVQDPPPIEAQIIAKTDANALIAYGGVPGADKGTLEGTMQRIAQVEREKESVPTDDKHYYYSASNQLAWNGSYVKTWYDNTHVYIHAAPFYVSTSIDGHTKTAWLGGNPYYSDAIQLSERWKFKGHGISVSVGSGGLGGSWQAAGDTVTFSSGWVDTSGWAYGLSNLYNGVFADSHISLYEVDDSATGSHRFGNQIVTTTCNGGKRWWLW